MTVIEARSLSLGYDGRAVIDGIDLSVEEGDLVSIVGPNGSGKSTLLRALSRNLRPFSGEVLLDGRSIERRPTKEVARRLAFLAQSPSVPNELTVIELVEHGRFPYAPWTGALGAKDREVVDWALDATALSSLRHRMVATLSGGERQRAWIAMALAQESPILFLDEPTTFLDIHHQLQIMELVGRMNRDMGRTIVMVLHDLNQAARFSRRMIALKDGRIHSEGKPEGILTPATLREVFGIDSTVLRDESSGCPYFLPVGSVGR
jgi:iron complex transport system ATP-binding protein